MLPSSGQKGIDVWVNQLTTNWYNCLVPTEWVALIIIQKLPPPLRIFSGAATVQKGKYKWQSFTFESVFPNHMPIGNMLSQGIQHVPKLCGLCQKWI